MASAEDAPEDKWRLISPEALAKFTVNYGFGGRRVTERDAGGKVSRCREISFVCFSSFSHQSASGSYQSPVTN